jgi:hypothetical protein
VIDAQFVDGNIATEKMLTYPTKRAQEVTQTRPHAVNGVGMGFANASAIIVMGPFSLAMPTVERLRWIVL